MKVNTRFIVETMIAILGVLIGSAAIWLVDINRGRPRSIQSRQIPQTAIAGPATGMADADLLKGCNVIVCSRRPEQRRSLSWFVSERGGRVLSDPSAMNVDTDFVLLEANADAHQFASVMQEAHELHIPVGDQSKLLRLARSW
jgi:hypothetical protein